MINDKLIIINNLMKNMGITFDQAVENMGLTADKEKLLTAMKELDKVPAVVTPEQRSCVPVMINREYEALMELLSVRNLYGAIFKIRDVFEIIMKVPTLMAMIIINQSYTEKTEQEQMACQEEYRAILDAMLSGALSMGRWQELMVTVKKYGDKFELGDTLTEILDRTNQCLCTKFGKYESVVQWRNETIGHGILMLNKEEEDWVIINQLLRILQDYFTDAPRNRKTINSLYGSVYYIANGQKLIGMTNHQMRMEGLENQGKIYRVTSYIYPRKNELFYFDSFYRNKRRVKITNYTSDILFRENDEFFNQLNELYKKMELQLNSRTEIKKVMTYQEQSRYDFLHEPVAYQRQDYILKQIREAMDSAEKGIILLQMEQGMGKSTLSHEINGAYAGDYIQKNLNAIVRTYHISNIELRGIGDYYISYINNFKINGKDRDVLRDRDDQQYSQWYHNLTKRVEISQSIVDLMDFFRKTYLELSDEVYRYNADLVYILDGMDELPDEAAELIETLPEQKQLHNKSYILLTSRFSEELSGSAREKVKRLEKIAEKNGTRIQIHSDDEGYRNSLCKYTKEIAKTIPSMKGKVTAENIDQIIKKSDYKFLYIRPYLELGEDVFRETGKSTTAAVAENYIQMLVSRYWGTNRKIMNYAVSAIALFKQLTIEEFCEMILMDDVTFDAIGCFNDLSPLLTVYRGEKGNEYGYANDEYRAYVLAHCQNWIKETITSFFSGFNSWFTKKKKILEESWEKPAEWFLEYPVYLTWMSDTLNYLNKNAMISNIIDLPVVDHLSEFMKYGTDTILTEEAHKSIERFMPRLYISILDRNILCKKEKTLFSIRNYLWTSEELLNALYEYCRKNEPDPWFDLLFASDSWDMQTEEAKHVPYGSMWNISPLQEKKNACTTQIIQYKSDDPIFIEYLCKNLETEIANGNTVFQPMQYLEEVAEDMKPSFMKTRVQKLLVKGYLINGDIFEQYISDHKKHIEHIISDLKNIDEMDEILESELSKLLRLLEIRKDRDILEEACNGAEKIITEEWKERYVAETRSAVHKIENAIRITGWNPEMFADSFEKLVDIIEKAAGNCKDVYADIIYRYFEVIYINLSKSEKKEKLVWLMEQVLLFDHVWGGVEWNLYHRYFSGQPEFIKFQEFFSAFAKGKHTYHYFNSEVPDYIWKNSLEVLKHIQKNRLPEEYEKYMSQLDIYSARYKVSVEQFLQLYSTCKENGDIDGMKSTERKISQNIENQIDGLLEKITEMDQNENLYNKWKIEHIREWNHDLAENISFVKNSGMDLDKTIALKLRNYKDYITDKMREEVHKELRQWYQALAEDFTDTHKKEEILWLDIQN